MLQLPRLIQEFNFAGFSKVLPKKMACSRLQRLAILHHGLDGKRIHRSRKSLAVSLATLDHRHGHPVLREVLVYIQHLHGFFARLYLGGMRGVTLLPQKFRGAQK